MKFTQEQLTPEITREIDHLLHKHRDELSAFPEARLNPNYIEYAALQESGNLICFFVRDNRKNNEIVGYSAFFIKQHIHYQDVKCAYQDVFYLHPKHRGKMVGVKFIKWCETQLSHMHVDAILQHAKVGTEFERILPRVGYELHEVSYIKRLN